MVGRKSFGKSIQMGKKLNGMINCKEVAFFLSFDEVMDGDEVMTDC